MPLCRRRIGWTSVESSPRTASHSDLPAIASTLGAAFVDDPVMSWLLDGRAADATRVGCVYRAVAHGHLGDGLSTVTGACEAVAIWAAPGRYAVAAHRFVRYLPCLLGALGAHGLRRVPSMAAVEKLHPGEPHYYLAALGTHPDHQHKGLGSAAMAPLLARADGCGVPCYLESSKEENLAFYSRHGFEVTGTHDLEGGSGPRLWLMWREPRGVGS